MIGIKYTIRISTCVRHSCLLLWSYNVFCTSKLLVSVSIWTPTNAKLSRIIIYLIARATARSVPCELRQICPGRGGGSDGNEVNDEQRLQTSSWQLYSFLSFTVYEMFTSEICISFTLTCTMGYGQM